MIAAWTIARRELRSLFDHPTGYVLLVVFVIVNDFLFFRQAYLLGVASLRPMLDLLPWVLLFLVPAVTMRALADDTRLGTLEVVLAQPVTELELLAGKYLGQLLFLWIALALTIPVPLLLSLGADLHAGVVVAQYVGSALLAVGLCGVGIWTSSIARHQITAFIVGVAVMFPLILIGLNPLIVGLPPWLAGIAQSLGVTSHFQNIARGVIDLRDAVYFVTLAALFLTFAFLSLMSRKLSHGGDALRRLMVGTALLAAAIVVVNLFGRHIGGRLDLTPDNSYTLSRATKDLLRDLDDLVTIKLVASKELPTQVAISKRDIDDLLSDVRAAGGGNVRVIELVPGEDDGAEEEARNLGIPPIQFNVVGEDEFQVKEGYLGLAVQYADGTETIPFVGRTDDLEYRIASFVRSLTATELPVVGLVEQSTSRDPGATYRNLRGELEQNYEVRTVSVADSLPIDSAISVLVLAGSPFMLTDSQTQRFEEFFRRGGGALVLASGMRIEQEQFMATARPMPWNKLLAPYGVSIKSDLAFDLASNEQVGMPTQYSGMRVFVPYPLWIRALSTRQVAVNREIESVFLPWASSVDTAEARPGTVAPLLTTSRAGGAETARALIVPQREFPTDSLGVELLAVQVNPLAADSVGEMKARLIVVGNSDFVTDRFAEQGSPNLNFVLNAVDWLAQDEALMTIRAKNRRPPPLVWESDAKRDFVKYANVAGVPILIVLAAVLRLLGRRAVIARKYERSRVGSAT